MKGGKATRVLHLLATAMVIAAAALLWQNLPTPDDVYGPFDVHAGVGQRATGRGVTAQVDAVRIAPRIRGERESAPVIDALGAWVVIDGEAMTTLRDESLKSELILGPNTYRRTDRVSFLPITGSLAPGITVRGSWVFDVPVDLVAAGAQPMTLRLWVGDGRQDSRLVVDIPVDDPKVSRTDLVRLEPATQVGT